MMRGTEASYTVALYIRLSLEDSKTDSLSIKNQKQLLYRYADSMEGTGKMEILEFVDNGYSGTNFERPAVQELLEQVRKGKINCILVKDFSRFGRNSIEVGYFMERVFPLYGVRFISVNDNFDSARLHGDTGGLDVAFKYLVSEFYSRDLSIKIKSAKHIKMKCGEYQSTRCPYGYQKGADGRLEPDPNTAPIVRFIFLLAQNGYTISQIIQCLFDRNMQTPGAYKAQQGKDVLPPFQRANIWADTTISHILKDERYVGTYIAGRQGRAEPGSRRQILKDASEWIKIPNHHPAIVNRELFEQVQIRFSQTPKNQKQKKVEYLLRSKVFCGCCRHTMKRSYTKNAAFSCAYTLIDEDASCHRLRILEKDLERMIYELLSKQALAILNADVLHDSNWLDVQLAKKNDCRTQIQTLYDTKRMLYEQFLLQEITLDNYKAQKSVLDQELNRLEQIHSTLSTQTGQMQAEHETQAVQQKLARDITQASGLTQKLVDTLVERVYVYPDNRLEIIWKIQCFF